MNVHRTRGYCRAAGRRTSAALRTRGLWSHRGAKPGSRPPCFPRAEAKSQLDSQHCPTRSLETGEHRPGLAGLFSSTSKPLLLSLSLVPSTGQALRQASVHVPAPWVCFLTDPVGPGHSSPGIGVTSATDWGVGMGEGGAQRRAHSAPAPGRKAAVRAGPRRPRGADLGPALPLPGRASWRARANEWAARRRNPRNYPRHQRPAQPARGSNGLG